MTTSCNNSGGTKRGDAGFTLIEVLVSLTLIALLLALTPPALRVARDAWTSDAQLERAQGIRAANDAIRRAIGGVWPARMVNNPSRQAFDGVADDLRFVAPGPRASDGTLQTVRIYARPRPQGGRDLVMAMTPYGFETSGPGATDTVLVENIDAFGVRYFGPIGNQQRGWTDRWSQRIALPQLVEVSYSIAGSTRPRETITVALRLADMQ